MKRIALLALALTHGTAALAVLNGTVVDFADHPHTVLVRTGADTASGVVVGPRVVLTTRYGFGPHASVEVDGRRYAVVRSQTHAMPGGELFGLAALLLAEPIEGAQPLTIAESGPSVDDEVQLVGYGPWSATMSASFSLFLSVGTTRVSKWEKQNGFVMEGSTVANFGDAGGAVTDGAGVLYGIMTQSDLKTKTYATNLGIHRKFLFDFAQASNVAICGVTELCAQP